MSTIALSVYFLTIFNNDKGKWEKDEVEFSCGIRLREPRMRVIMFSIVQIDLE
jgi:hypothetical protein